MSTTTERVEQRLRRWQTVGAAPFVRVLARVGISPNTISWAGVIASLLVAWTLAQGHFRIGGILFLLASAMDLLDGALARSTGQASRFGALLDSTLDRISEAVVFFGLLAYYAPRAQVTEVLLIFTAFVGSVMVSYVRARAEGLGIPSSVGLLTRRERVLLLSIGLITQFVTPVLWVLAVFTLVTAAQRLYHVQRTLRGTVEGERGGYSNQLRPSK